MERAVAERDWCCQPAARLKLTRLVFAFRMMRESQPHESRKENF
jgi:hypothetical protein